MTILEIILDTYSVDTIILDGKYNFAKFPVIFVWAEIVCEKNFVRLGFIIIIKTGTELLWL